MKNQRSNLACGLSLFVLVIGCTTVSDEGKAWRAPERLDDQDKAKASFGVALDADSRGLVVWSDNTLIGRIFSRSHTQDGGWGPKTQAHIAAEDAFWPTLAMDTRGNAVTIWGQRRRSDGRDSIWSSRYPAGSGWDGAVQLDSENDDDATKRHVAMDESGNAIAVWQQSDGTRENIWANRSTLDDGWDTAELIEFNDGGHASDPRVAVDIDGNAVAVWHQADGARVNIWANHYTPSGDWSIARQVDDSDEGEARLPDVAMDPDGNAVVVWQQSNGSRYDIWANRFTPTGGWDEAERIDNDHSGDATDPKVGIDADGVAIAVWKQFDGITDEIWSNRYAPNGGWGASERLEDNDDGDALRPRIAVSANGEAVAVWPESDGSRYDLWARAYTPLEGWGIAERVDPTDQGPGEPVKAEVAIDPNGNAMAVWLRRDPADPTALLSTSQLWAARYE